MMRDKTEEYAQFLRGWLQVSDIVLPYDTFLSWYKMCDYDVLAALEHCIAFYKEEEKTCN